MTIQFEEKSSRLSVLTVDVEKRLGDFRLAAKFEIAGGATALFGPSGAGKSTVANLIAGLIRPVGLQRQFGVGAAEEVTFVQRSAEAYRYRDAVRFQSGREILLQYLHCGQRVDVLCLSSGDFEEKEHQRHAEECRRIFAFARLSDKAPKVPSRV